MRKNSRGTIHKWCPQQIPFIKVNVNAVVRDSFTVGSMICMDYKGVLSSVFVSKIDKLGLVKEEAEVAKRG